MRGFTPMPSVDLLLLVAFLFCGNFILRQKHPHEVYVIWLVFSFLFSIFLPIAYIAETNHTNLEGVCTSYQVACAKIYEMLTDFNAEVKFLFIFAFVTIAPQVLAYFLAGVWGTATAPQYVWVVKQTAIWSFIKFVAGLGGIFMAQALAKLFAGEAVCINDFLPAVGYTAIAFVYATLNFGIREAWERFYKRHFLGAQPEPWYIRWIIAFHRKCTRKVPTRPAPTLARRALIELAKSDAVYDYITRTRSAG